MLVEGVRGFTVVDMVLGIIGRVQIEERMRLVESGNDLFPRLLFNDYLSEPLLCFFYLLQVAQRHILVALIDAEVLGT